MERKIIEKHLYELRDIQDERNNYHIDWLKNTVTIASGLLAVLVSLKTEKSETNFERILYMITIISIGIGILSGVMVLFSYLIIHNRSLNKKKEQIIDVLNDKEIESLENISRPKIYETIEYICYGSFFVSLCALIIYGIVSDF